MSGMNRLQRGVLSSTASLLVHTGPRLMRVRTMRRPIIGMFEDWLSNTLKDERASRRYPAGVNDDRAMMTMALLRTIERAICDRYLAPNVLRRASENLIQSALIDRGDRLAAENFRHQYGTHPLNINQVYARGGTLNDAWADGFFTGIRDWQDGYRTGKGNGRPGNWMAPCLIRDHHADFRRLVMEHEPEPADDNATEALLDPDYAQGMIDYDEAYQSLADEISEQYYLHPEEVDQDRKRL